MEGYCQIWSKFIPLLIECVQNGSHLLRHKHAAAIAISELLHRWHSAPDFLLIFQIWSSVEHGTFESIPLHIWQKLSFIHMKFYEILGWPEFTIIFCKNELVQFSLKHCVQSSILCPAIDQTAFIQTMALKSIMHILAHLFTSRISGISGLICSHHQD